MNSLVLLHLTLDHLLLLYVFLGLFDHLNPVISNKYPIAYYQAFYLVKTEFPVNLMLVSKYLNFDYKLVLVGFVPNFPRNISKSRRFHRITGTNHY